MVAPKEQVLACTECHSRNGRLTNVPGFYLLGRDRGTAVDSIGIGMVLLTLLGVGIHGFIRITNVRH
jgi:hypothetical protein